MKITRTDSYGEKHTFAGVRAIEVYEYGERFNLHLTFKDGLKVASNDVTNIIVEAEKED